MAMKAIAIRLEEEEKDWIQSYNTTASGLAQKIFRAQAAGARVLASTAFWEGSRVREPSSRS